MFSPCSQLLHDLGLGQQKQHSPIPPARLAPLPREALGHDEMRSEAGASTSQIHSRVPPPGRRAQPEAAQPIDERHIACMPTVSPRMREKGTLEGGGNRHLAARAMQMSSRPPRQIPIPQINASPAPRKIFICMQIRAGGLLLRRVAARCSAWRANKSACAPETMAARPHLQVLLRVLRRCPPGPHIFEAVTRPNLDGADGGDVARSRR